MVKKPLFFVCLFFISAIFYTIFLTGDAFSENAVDQVAAEAKTSVKAAIKMRQSTQKDQDKWALEKEKLINEYNALKEKKRDLTSLNQELSLSCSETKRKIENIESKIKEIAIISENLAPFLNKSCEELKIMVDQGPPMLLNEREMRLAKLEKTLKDKQISASEKFRKTMEALFIEAEYGNTIEVYQKNIMLENKSVLADIFRLGRLSLFCRTPDGKTTGYYNEAEHAWQKLDTKYNPAINRACAMGAKREPIDFLSLPVGRMVVQ
ncbi:MAG: DUF3450 domain-containing protein [Thermodesulfobacteriota bacterium]|nr:DUF3450 domain-containing protein [Thermodesulfobacteriota bacterium]